MATQSYFPVYKYKAFNFCDYQKFTKILALIEDLRIGVRNSLGIKLHKNKYRHTTARLSFNIFKKYIISRNTL